MMIWLEGCGAGILLMLPFAWVHISPLHVDLYHRLLPMNTVFGGVAIDLVIACLLCTGVFCLLGRSDPDGNTLWWILVAAVLAIKLFGLIEIAGILGHFDAPIGGLLFLAMNCFALALVLWFLERSWYRKAVAWFCRGMVMLGFCILWVLPQLVYMAIRPEPHDTQKFVRAVAPAQVPQRRIVWILFDELSQDQSFDHRPPGISLPELDQFRSQSVMFSDMRPAGFYTENVVPSLLWGNVVYGIRSDLAGNLFVKTSSRWQRFPVEHSIFADAQREGWSRGVAGWFNPYCRTYRASLDWCASVVRFNIPGNYSPEKSLWWNANAPLALNESKLTGREDVVPPKVRQANDYTDLMQWSHELIHDEKIGFVFLHLPLPHPPGFYDRQTGKLGVDGGGYLDNLVLTDRSLGKIMQWIGKTKLASNTTVIVCSDHSWRVPLWRGTPGWTKEDEKASRGKFDTRPVLMVHFPGETTPEVVSKPFPALKEHDLIESLLHQPMTVAGLKDWARK